MKVRIVKCELDNSWYCNRVNQLFDVLEWDSLRYVVLEADKNKPLVHLIYKSDCEIIKESPVNEKDDKRSRQRVLKERGSMKRYDLGLTTVNKKSFPKMEENPDGKWVKHKDIDYQPCKSHLCYMCCPVGKDYCGKEPCQIRIKEKA